MKRLPLYAALVFLAACGSSAQVLDTAIEVAERVTDFYMVAKDLLRFLVEQLHALLEVLP